MNKKVVVRILIALAVYGIFVALVLNFSNDSPSNMDWKDRESFNRQYISKLKLGELKFEQALEELGSPDLTEAKQEDNINYQVLFYRTQHVKSDGITTQSECSYLLFIDDTLVEFSQASKYQGLDSVIKKNKAAQKEVKIDRTEDSAG